MHQYQVGLQQASNVIHGSNGQIHTNKTGLGEQYEPLTHWPNMKPIIPSSYMKTVQHDWINLSS
jgi:hypothetical protein